MLILCYNKALAAALVERLGPHAPRNIEIRHFHSWVARRTGLRKGEAESFEDYERRMIGTMLRGAEHWTEAEKYDAILIDEAHDFEPDWFRCATSMLRGGPDGDILIAADSAQSLYGRDRKFTWSSVGVQARGRSRRLTHNYRNTKQILEFAWQVAQSTVQGDAESETLVRLVPTRVLRRGPFPCYRGCNSVDEEHALIARQVQRFRDKGIAPKEIAVVYPRNERGRIDPLCQVLRRTGEVNWISNESDPHGGVRSLGQPGVRLATVHAAKGLEFTAVIFCALDQLPNTKQIDEVRDNNLLYVGLTRATDELVITWAGRSAFTDRLPFATKAVAMHDTMY